MQGVEERVGAHSGARINATGDPVQARSLHLRPVTNPRCQSGGSPMRGLLPDTVGVPNPVHSAIASRSAPPRSAAPLRSPSPTVVIETVAVRATLSPLRLRDRPRRRVY